MRKRLVRYSVYAAIVPLLVIASVLITVLYSTAGTNWAVTLAKTYLPSELTLGVVHGQLAGPLTLENISYDTSAVSVTLQRATLTWSVAQLMMGTVQVETMHFEKLAVVLHDTSGSSSPEPSTTPVAFTFPELPVDVVVGEFTIDDARLDAYNVTSPILVDRFELAAHASDDELNVSRLKVSGPQFDVAADARLQNTSDLALNTSLRYAIDLTPFSEAFGQLDLNGTLDYIELNANVDAPYNIAVVGVIEHALDQPEIDITMQVKQLDLAAVNVETTELVLTTTANLKGLIDDLRLTLDGEAEVTDLGIVKLAIEAAYSPKRVQLSQLLLSLPEGGTSVELRGKLEPADASGNVELDGSWQHLTWPLERGLKATQTTVISSDEGHFNVRGTLDDYSLSVASALAVPNQTDGYLKLVGHGTTEQVALTAIDLSTLGGHLEGSLQTRWSPALNVAFDLNGQDFNPAGIAPAWPGRLAVDLLGEINFANETTEVRAVLEVDGSLRDLPVQLRLSGNYNDDEIRLNAAKLTSGSFSLTADGSLGPASDLAWSVSGDDLGDLVPAASGKIEGRGSVRGHWQTPNLGAQLSVIDLGYATNHLKSLELTADVNLLRDAPSEVRIKADQIQVGGVVLPKLSFDLLGPINKHTIALSVQSAVGVSNLGVLGSWQDDNVYAFSLEQLSLAPVSEMTFELADSVHGRISAGSFSLTPVCLHAAISRICIEVSQQSEHQRAALNFESLPLDLINGDLTDPVVLGGDISGEFELTNWAESASVNAGGKVRFNDVRLLTTTATDEQQTVLAFEPGDMTLSLSESDGLLALFVLPLQTTNAPQTGGIEARLQVAAGEQVLVDRDLTGSIAVNLPDITFINSLTPHVSEVRGRVEGDMEFSGTLSTPQVRGNLALVDAQVAVAAAEILITDLMLQVDMPSEETLSVVASAHSGTGSLTMEGSISQPFADAQSNFDITGERFAIMNTAQALVHISPQLNVTTSPAEVRVKGKIAIPTANLHLKKLPPSAQTESEDQILVSDDDETNTGAESIVNANVRLILGDDVTFEGYGLEAQFAGDLTVVERPDEPTSAKGEVTIVRGQYQAYGQDLNIEGGKLIWVGGAIDKPGLDILATRQPKPDIKVGILARGTLNAPDITLMSEPTLPESDQLSYLILGRPIDNSSAAESSYINTAALALGIKGGNYLTEKFGGNLGVDQIGIESAPGEDADQAALVVGKYLTPKLYVSYGLGLLESISTLRLEYSLTKHWQLTTESSSEQSGGDIVYTIER